MNLASSDTRKQRSLADTIRLTLQSNWFYLTLLLLLILFPYIVTLITGDSPYGVGGRPRGQSVFWQSVMIEVFVFAILAISYNLMFGFTGVISFGHALFFGLGGYTLGIVLEMGGMSSDVALLIGALGGMLLAGIVGFIMALVTLRLKGVYFAIFTLAISEMAFIWVGRWALTNAEDGIALSNLPELFNTTRNRLFYYYFALTLAVLTFLFVRRLINSPTGRVLLAIRENEDRAQSIGYDTLRYKLLAITVASVMASMAGMIHVVLNKKVGPEIMSVNYTIEPLLMVIIGGIGTFSGPLIGSAGLILSERILNREFIIAGSSINIGSSWSLILGIAFIVVVLIFPQGIVGTVQRWRYGRRQRRVPSQPSPSDSSASSSAAD